MATINGQLSYEHCTITVVTVDPDGLFIDPAGPSGHFKPADFEVSRAAVRLIGQMVTVTYNEGAPPVATAVECRS